MGAGPRDCRRSVVAVVGLVTVAGCSTNAEGDGDTAFASLGTGGGVSAGESSGMSSAEEGSGTADASGTAGGVASLVMPPLVALMRSVHIDLATAFTAVQLNYLWVRFEGCQTHQSTLNFGPVSPVSQAQHDKGKL